MIDLLETLFNLLPDWVIGLVIWVWCVGVGFCVYRKQVEHNKATDDYLDVFESLKKK